MPACNQCFDAITSTSLFEFENTEVHSYTTSMAESISPQSTWRKYCHPILYDGSEVFKRRASQMRLMMSPKNCFSVDLDKKHRVLRDISGPTVRKKY